MAASRSSERSSSKKLGKGPGIESAAAVDLTVSPAAPVASSSMNYMSSSSSSSSSSSHSSSSATGTAREAQAPPRKPFVLHGSPIGGFTSLGTAPKEQVSGDVNQPSAFLVPDPTSVLSATSDPRTSASRRPGPVVTPAVATTQKQRRDAGTAFGRRAETALRTAAATVAMMTMMIHLYVLG